MWRKSFSFLFRGVFTLQSGKRKHKTKNMKLKLDGSEASMIPIIAKHSSLLFNSSKSLPITFQEFTVGRGIADVYLVKKDKRGYGMRKLSSVPAITDKAQNEIVSLISFNPGISMDDLHTLLMNKRLSNVETNLDKLIDTRAIYFENDRLYVDQSVVTNVIDYSVAIEAKVSDWKKGLKQALRYKNFADKSYLALYDKHIKVAKANVKIFEALNIGLIGISEEGITIYYQPVENQKDPQRSYLASERAYSLIDDTQDSFLARNNIAAYSATA